MPTISFLVNDDHTLPVYCYRHSFQFFTIVVISYSKQLLECECKMLTL